VVFDVDGTLTATTGVDDACLVGAWGEVFGVSDVETDWSKYAHSTDEGLTLEVCRRGLGRPPTREEVGRVQRVFFGMLRERIAAEPERCRPVPGVREMLAAARSRGWKVGIASGAWEESARIKLAAAGVDVDGLPGTFSHVRAGAAAEGWTPVVREEIVSATLAKLGRWSGGANAPAVYVGDGVWDAKAARNLRIGFVGVRIDGREERLRDSGARRIVRNYADLQAALRQIADEIGEGA
jgi:phosphoglycolate phosphatase-like HAD superfamily hydrolase